MSEFTEFAEFTKFTAAQDLDTVNDSTTRGVSEVTGLDFDLIWRVELIESGSGGGGGGQLNRDLRLSRRTVDQREERCILYRSRVNYDLLQKNTKP